MNIWVYVGVVGIGIIAGFINTLAGSGSLLSLPMLMIAGLPANVANGTNRIAILLQNVVGSAGFKKQKILNTRDGITLAIPAIIGSIAGAQIAVNVNEEVMKMAIAGLLIVMFFIILFKPSIWIKGRAGSVTPKSKMINMVVFFLIGVYGGFIQAGVGFFLLAGLVLSAGKDLVKANALKVFIVLLYTPLALVVFMLHHQVNYQLGLILAIGNMTGAYIGTKVAASWGPKFVRIFLMVILIFAALQLFGLIDITSLFIEA